MSLDSPVGGVTHISHSDDTYHRLSFGLRHAYERCLFVMYAVGGRALSLSAKSTAFKRAFSGVLSEGESRNNRILSVPTHLLKPALSCSRAWHVTDIVDLQVTIVPLFSLIYHQEQCDHGGESSTQSEGPISMLGYDGKVELTHRHTRFQLKRLSCSSLQQPISIP